MADKTKDLMPADGVTKREDHDFYEVVYGSHGEVTVLAKDDRVLTPEQRQEVIDKSIELSATPVAEDVRHSAHPDHMDTDGTYTNRDDSKPEFTDEQIEAQRKSAGQVPAARDAE